MTSLQISPAEAATELLRRREARRSLIKFTEYTFDGYEPAAHHRLIADKLEAVARGEITRLAIFMPPRHGKSELVSKRFPAWYLGHNPAREIIVASYGQDLAQDFGRAARNIVKSDDYQKLFETRVADDTSAAARWMTTAGGSFVAAGVGTAITGRGAHVAIIDDPVKDREAAESETIREATWNWYTSTLRTRLAPGGALVLCQTRWHFDDLSGRILEHDRESWDIIDLPALSDDGLALWPERFSVKALEETKHEIGPRDWEALYQQRPAPDEGAFFRREWFRYFDREPSSVRIIGASDYAVTADGGDYTVHVVGALDANDCLHVLDVWRRQTETDEWIAAFCGLVKSRQPLRWGEEKGQIIKSVGPYLEREMRQRRVSCYREQYTSAVDKPTRARSLQARMATGRVLFRRDAHYLDDLEPELLMFPSGKHDDQVDALALLARVADEIGPPARKKVTDRYREARKKRSAAKRSGWAA